MRMLLLLLLRLLILPELNSTTSISITQHISCVIVKREILRSGSEKRNNTNANTNTECSSGIGSIKRVRIGEHVGLFMVVVMMVMMIEIVVERGSRGGHNEDITETNHRHI
jgi:hypothetical protein